MSREMKCTPLFSDILVCLNPCDDVFCPELSEEIEFRQRQNTWTIWNNAARTCKNLIEQKFRTRCG